MLASKGLIMSLINKSIKSAVKAAYRSTTTGGSTTLRAIELMAKDSLQNAKAKGSKSERAEKFANKYFDLHESGIKRSVSAIVDAHLQDEDLTGVTAALNSSKDHFVASELEGDLDGIKAKLSRKAIKASSKDAKVAKRGLKAKFADLI